MLSATVVFAPRIPTDQVRPHRIKAGKGMFANRASAGFGDPNELPERNPAATFRVTMLLPWVYLGILACVNIYICREAFVTASSGHWNSIHGQWMSLARIAALDWLRPTWWPYWGGGAPLEFTYAPLVPVAIAVM